MLPSQQRQLYSKIQNKINCLRYTLGSKREYIFIFYFYFLFYNNVTDDIPPHHYPTYPKYEFQEENTDAAV